MSDRVLVLYGTTDGHTAKVADAIARALRFCRLEADVVNAKVHDPSVRPEDYAAVIVAASVHAGGYQKSVVKWVQTHVTELHRRPTAFVSVCLGVLQHEAKVDLELQAILRRFNDLTHWRPGEVKVVAGALPYTKYWWGKRWVMRRIVAKAHGDIDTTRDYEYTDWRDLAEFVRRFAQTIAAPLASRAAG
jgi:menaquinone-dependent protoporphyrinogen oxidase